MPKIRIRIDKTTNIMEGGKSIPWFSRPNSTYRVCEEFCDVFVGSHGFLLAWWVMSVFPLLWMSGVYGSVNIIKTRRRFLPNSHHHHIVGFLCPFARKNARFVCCTHLIASSASHPLFETDNDYTAFYLFANNTSICCRIQVSTCVIILTTPATSCISLLPSLSFRWDGKQREREEWDSFKTTFSLSLFPQFGIISRIILVSEFRIRNVRSC